VSTSYRRSRHVPALSAADLALVHRAKLLLQSACGVTEPVAYHALRMTAMDVSATVTEVAGWVVVAASDRDAGLDPASALGEGVLIRAKKFWADKQREGVKT
jgi:hypothetical protein